MEKKINTNNLKNLIKIILNEELKKNDDKFQIIVGGECVETASTVTTAGNKIKNIINSGTAIDGIDVKVNYLGAPSKTHSASQLLSFLEKHNL